MAEPKKKKTKKPLAELDLAEFEKAMKEKFAERMPNATFRCVNCPPSCKCSGQGAAIGAGEYVGSTAGSLVVD